MKSKRRGSEDATECGGKGEGVMNIDKRGMRDKILLLLLLLLA